MDLIESKTYPDEYPAEAVKVLNTMTFPGSDSELLILGSASLRSQHYAGDYDGYNKVKGSLPNLIEEFKTIIRNLKKLPNVYISDIKAGEIEEWRVVPLNRRKWKDKAAQKIESLLRQKIIRKEEVAPITNYLIAKKDIKFHIIKWTPEEVLAGHKTLRDGRRYTLEEAFTAPAIVKLDTIAPVKGKYTDFSVIYEFRDGEKRLNDFPMAPKDSIQEDIKYYTMTNNPYKALKRKFALAKLQNNMPALKRYNKIINSELGKLYLVYSEVKTLADLLEAGRDVEGIQKILSTIGLPPSLEADIKKVKTKADYPILRHIESEVLKQLSKGTRLKGGDYCPYNPEVCLSDL
jgi:hypothetical protein